MTRFEKLGAVPLARMGEGEDAEEVRLLHEMLQEAEKYMMRFSWCRAVKSTYFGIGVGKIFAVFLFEIDHAEAPEEDLLWVVVGDIPPTYLVTLDGSESPLEALETYVELMSEWVQAVRQGKSVKELIPVNVSPTLDYAEQLAGRLEFIKEKFLNN
jgi:hypothetical protein